MSRDLTPRERRFFRIIIVIALPFLMIWNMVWTFFEGTYRTWRDTCQEPLIVWGEFIVAFRKGQP